MVAFTNSQPVDETPLVQPRRPRLSLIDGNSDGIADVYLWDCDHDGEPEIEHHVASRKTLLTLANPAPWCVPPSLTYATGDGGQVPLRVTVKVQSLGGKVYELNGTPALPVAHAMASLSLAWDADRERDDEVCGAMALLRSHGGLRMVERI